MQIIWLRRKISGAGARRLFGRRRVTAARCIRDPGGGDTNLVRLMKYPPHVPSSYRTPVRYTTQSLSNCPPCIFLSMSVANLLIFKMHFNKKKNQNTEYHSYAWVILFDNLCFNNSFKRQRNICSSPASLNC